jgi:hypothetical protein
MLSRDIFVSLFIKELHHGPKLWISKHLYSHDSIHNGPHIQKMVPCTAKTLQVVHHTHPFKNILKQ